MKEVQGSSILSSFYAECSAWIGAVLGALSVNDLIMEQWRIKLPAETNWLGRGDASFGFYLGIVVA